MFQESKNVYENGKKSLETLLREKACGDVEESLKEQGINIDAVSEEDIEVLVEAKVEDMKNSIKGFGVGAAFTMALSLLLGA